MAKMRHSSKNKIPLIFLVFILLSLGLIGGEKLGVMGGIRGAMEGLVIPVKSTFFKLSPKGSSLENEGQRLDLLSSQIAVLKQENEAMKKLLGTPLPPSWRFEVASVIGLPTGGELQINKGRHSSLTKGMAVIIDNFFVGKVEWVGEYYSRVLLPTSSGAKILAETQSSPTTKGILEEQGGKVFLDKVLMNEDLKEGDLVVTAGDEELPPNLLIGKILRVYRREGEIYQKGEVELSLSANKLQTVFVVVAR